MKSRIVFLFIALIHFSINIHAQKHPKTYNERMKIVTSELDASKFKNNTLYDRVYPIAKLGEFNQNKRKDTSNYQHFSQAVHELHLASEKRSMISADALEQLSLSENGKGHVLVGIINMDFTTLKKEAFDSKSNLLTVDDSGRYKKMREVAGKEAIEHKQALVISPTQYQIDQVKGKGVTFSFKNALLQHSKNPIRTLSVSFENEKRLFTIIQERRLVNATATYKFAKSGKQTLRFSGTYQDGKTFTTFAMINIDIITPINGIKKVRATESFTPYTSENDYSDYTPINEMAEIEYKVFPSTNPARTKIIKPIIITDGIDYNDVRDCDFLYKEQLKQNDTGNKLGDKLRNLGYDVIIVNYPKYKIGVRENEYCIKFDESGNCIKSFTESIDIFRKGGADYIQRNAQALKQLIRNLNTKLTYNGSSEQMILIGPSMGGLVTRWALKEMENSGENHNVRIWVSFEGPHQGANVSTAIQYAARETDAWASLNKLKRPASKQMIVQHISSVNNNIISGGAPGFRNRFDNELNTLGYPENLRKVALINGSTQGELNHTPGQEFVYINTKFASFPWTNILDGHLHFTKNSNTNRVLYMNYSWYADGLLSDFSGYTSTSSAIGSYDNAPGCTFEMVGDADLSEDNLYSHISWSIFGFDTYTNITQYEDSFTFMTSKSTLDFQGNPNLNEPICYNLVASSETPFDSYFAPEHNEPHVQLNTSNVNWLLNELASEEATPPQTYCSEPVELTLNGSEELCPNSTGTYVLTPNNLTDVQWSVDGELEIINSNNQQITVRMNEPPHGPSFGEITATSGVNTVTKLVMCIPGGGPYYHVTYNESENVLLMLQNENDGIPLDKQGITDIKWELTSGKAKLLNATAEHIEVSGESFTGRVTISNKNGSTTKSFAWPSKNSTQNTKDKKAIQSLRLKIDKKGKSSIIK